MSASTQPFNSWPFCFCPSDFFLFPFPLVSTGEEYANKYKTLIYLAGSASAELIADVALCPFEAVKVRVQTQPGFANGLIDGWPKIVAEQGYGG